RKSRSTVVPPVFGMWTNRTARPSFTITGTLRTPPACTLGPGTGHVAKRIGRTNALESRSNGRAPGRGRPQAGHMSVVRRLRELSGRLRPGRSGAAVPTPTGVVEHFSHTLLTGWVSVPAGSPPTRVTLK